MPSYVVLTSGAKATNKGPNIVIGGDGGGLCAGSSDYPHLSGHNPGYVSAIGHTDCGAPVPYVHTEAKLYRYDCFLWPCWWTEVGSDAQTLFNAASTRAIPNHLCDGSAATDTILLLCLK